MYDQKNNPDNPAGQNGSGRVSSSRGPLAFFQKMSLMDKVTFVLCVIIIIVGFSLHLVRVVGGSMSPTYENGNLLVTTTHFDDEDIAYGCVVVVYNPEDINKHHLIKRVVGLPGDEIRIMDGFLYRNGEKITEEYPPMYDAGVAAEPVRLGEHEYFVLGDNRNNSSDSRVFGAVDRSEITNLVKGRFLFF